MVNDAFIGWYAESLRQAAKVLKPGLKTFLVHGLNNVDFGEAKERRV